MSPDDHLEFKVPLDNILAILSGQDIESREFVQRLDAVSFKSIEDRYLSAAQELSKESKGHLKMVKEYVRLHDEKRDMWVDVVDFYLVTIKLTPEQGTTVVAYNIETAS